jgi:hypothetical protein
MQQARTCENEAITGDFIFYPSEILGAEGT